MQAPDDGAGGAEGGAEGGAGAPEGPGGSGEHESCYGTAAEGTVAGGASELEGASPAPRNGEDASALASGESSGSQLLEFALRVPFLCYVDAEMARQYLISGEESFQGAAQMELAVIGSDLLIKLTAKDSTLLQISTATLLNQLSTIIQTMQHFVPPFFAKPRPGKGG